MTNAVKFLVQGSEEEPYVVVFSFDGKNLKASCSCTAGRAGLACKHRISILGACIDNIVSDNTEAVSEVCSWLPGSEVAVAIESLNIAEAEHERTKRELSAAKKTLAAAMWS